MVAAEEKTKGIVKINAFLETHLEWLPLQLWESKAEGLNTIVEPFPSLTSFPSVKDKYGPIM